MQAPGAPAAGRSKDASLFARSRSAVSAANREAASRESSQKSTHRRDHWGEKWSPNFPTEKQLCHHASLLWEENSNIRREMKAANASKLRAERAERAEGAGGGAEGAGAGARSPSAEAAAGAVKEARSAQPPRRPADSPNHSQVTAGEAISERILPSVQPGRRRYEPAKVYRDGSRVGLRGVKSTSDVTQFRKGFDMYGRKGWEYRKAFKVGQQQNFAYPSRETMRALWSFECSELPFQEWFENVTERGRKYHYDDGRR